MKKLSLFLLISVSAFICNAQNDSAFRDYGGFKIKYVYNWLRYMEPSIGRIVCDSKGVNCREDTAAYRLNRHYFADIYVYKNKKLVGTSFDGYYVINGCFEDVPEGEVKKAQYLQSVIDKNAALKIKNKPKTPHP